MEWDRFLETFVSRPVIAPCSPMASIPRAGISWLVASWFLRFSMVIRPLPNVVTISGVSVSTSIFIALATQMAAILTSLSSNKNSASMLPSPSGHFLDDNISIDLECNGTISLSEGERPQMWQLLSIFPNNTALPYFQLCQSKYQFVTLQFGRSVVDSSHVYCGLRHR